MCVCGGGRVHTPLCKEIARRRLQHPFQINPQTDPSWLGAAPLFLNICLPLLTR
jgi:hypothetical protein